MTKKKLVTNALRKWWQPVIDECVKLLMSEGVRTNNQSPRSKIRVKFPKTYYFKKPLPKCVIVEETDEYVIREWRTFVLLDWLAKWGIADWDSAVVYKNRQRLLMEFAHWEKELNFRSWAPNRDIVKEELLDSLEKED